MPAVRPNKIEMIPISRITVLNPRARNKRQHREIVNNIEAIGLKRPITVSRRDVAHFAAEKTEVDELPRGGACGKTKNDCTRG